MKIDYEKKIARHERLEICYKIFVHSILRISRIHI